MHDDEFRLETPEHVELQLELAGIGTRFAAGFVDSLLQLLVIAGVSFLLGFLGVVALPGGSVMRGSISALIVIASALLFIIAYYMVFELVWGGQSPGKRMAGLVVVRDDGGPLGFVESAIRNILRLVDGLPFFYTIGMVSVFFTRRSKRLGDIAAGTIVVKVRQVLPPPSVPATPDRADLSGPVPPLVLRAQMHVAALTPEEAETISRYVQRRMELEPTSRTAVAGRIADSVRHKFPSLSPAELPDPDTFLEVVNQARLLSRR